MLASNQNLKVAVASRSFSQDPFLKTELLKVFSNVKFNESGRSLKDQELIDFLKEADMAIIALEKVNDSVLQNLPRLKLVSKYGVGLDNIDFSALEKNNIKLAWKGGVNRLAVAELALSFIIGCIRGSFQSHHEIQFNEWSQFKGHNLSQKTVGILGLGHVGKELVPFLKPFNVKILAYDLYPKNEFCKLHQIEQTDLDSVLSKSDVITVHLPFTSQTKMILNAEKLSLMKPKSFLINTARGGLVDETALYNLLFKKHITSAAFDVFEIEPPISNPLLSLKQFYSTGHIGGSSIEAIHAMGLAAIEGLKSGGLTARPENFFNYPM